MRAFTFFSFLGMLILAGLSVLCFLAFDVHTRVIELDSQQNSLSKDIDDACGENIRCNNCRAAVPAQNCTYICELACDALKAEYVVLEEQKESANYLHVRYPFAMGLSLFFLGVVPFVVFSALLLKELCCSCIRGESNSSPV